MASSRSRLLAAGAFMALALLTQISCYKPNIAEGGLRCAEGGVCPEGFRCMSDGRCRQGPVPSCQDASPHVEPLCMPDAGVGAECDPICQNGCACGRCTYSAGALKCMPVGGAKKQGDFCNAGADDCAPGNVCMTDCNGAVARCFRFCGTNGAMDNTICEGGQKCDNNLKDPSTGAGTSINLCAVPVATCDPVGDGSDCGNGALGCYVSNSGGVPVCDCKGTSQPGESCINYNSCTPGNRCVTIGGATTCHKTCRRNSNDCPSSSCTPIGGGDFGYCQ